MTKADKKRAKSGWMTHREYRANKEGLNIFFGAMIGVVMAGVENVSAIQFGLVLTLAGGFVVTLLYISASPRRIVYAAFALVVLGLAWRLALDGPVILGLDAEWLTTRILPAFSVWLMMILAVEFVPREQAEGGGEEGD